MDSMQVHGRTAGVTPGDHYKNDEEREAERKARAEWGRSATIRAEFGDVESYVHFKRAVARGVVKMIRREG